MSARNRQAKIRARQARDAGLRTDAAVPEGEIRKLFWIATRHNCGHALDYGIDVDKHPDDYRERLAVFLTVASRFPCVRCGSSTGTPHDRPVSSEPTYLVANDVFYRACAQDVQAAASHNAGLARDLMV